MAMKFSDRAKHELLGEFEGCELTAYQDVIGVWTIGWGHTRGVKPGDTCTQAQADAWLDEDVSSVVDAINRDIKVPLTQHQFDALVSFGFNVGYPAMEGSTLWRKLNAGDYEGAAKEFPRWDMAGGKHIAGLLRRRKLEAYWFNLKDDEDGPV